MKVRYKKIITILATIFFPITLIVIFFSCAYTLFNRIVENIWTEDE